MDIDIDLPSNAKPLELFNQLVRASRVEKEEMMPHPVGYYFQYMAKDPISGLAAIPYKEAEEVGYFKIDFIHNTALNLFSSREEMEELSRKTPDWSLLEDKEIVDKLFHLKGHFDIVYRIKPKSVVEVADAIAFIRPNKHKLMDKYLKNKALMRKELYTVREKSHMKKSHSVAYAILVVLQLHLIKMGRL